VKATDWELFYRLSGPTTMRSKAAEQFIHANGGLKLSQSCHKEREEKSTKVP